MVYPLSASTGFGRPRFDPQRGLPLRKVLCFQLLILFGEGLKTQELRCINHNIVHAGHRTLYKWRKSMIEVAFPGTAAPVLLRNALHWPQASSGRRVGLMTRKQ